jgi:hypothetical protein
MEIPWKEVGKFFYLYVAGLAVPVLDFGLSITPEVSGLRSIVQVILPSRMRHLTQPLLMLCGNTMRAKRGGIEEPGFKNRAPSSFSQMARRWPQGFQRFHRT